MGTKHFGVCQSSILEYSSDINNANKIEVRDSRVTKSSCEIKLQKMTSQLELSILTGKKDLKIKLQRLRKIRIWTFGSLVHQINCI